MASAGEAVLGIEEVLRARANARRVKEHYEGTLGVPSELQSLSHLLAHDKNAVFEGLEKLPCYSKSDVPPTTPTLTAPDPHQRPRPSHRRHSPSPVAMPSFSSQLPGFSPPATAAGALPSSTYPDAWGPGRTTPASTHAVSAAGQLRQEIQQQQQQQQQEQQEEEAVGTVTQPEQQYPLEPGIGPRSGGRALLPSGYVLNPWRWTPNEDLGQAQAAGAAPGALDWVRGESQLRPNPNPNPSPTPQHTSPLKRGSTAAGNGTGTGSRPSPLQHPDSRAGASGSVPASRNGSPIRETPSGRYSGFGGFTGPQVPGYGSGSGPVSPAGTMFGSALEPETEEELKYRLARQRLLSANELSPQEWARIGPPQDAADLEKFIAQGYSVSVDYDRQTLLPKRVAKPDIFHISSEESHRRQMEAYEATLALQAMRRADEEAARKAEEQERLARSAARGPHYDSLGVLQAERTDAPIIMPRYLDWHPSTVGGLGKPMQRAQSGGSGGATGPNGTAVTSAGCSRRVSALRTRSETAAVATIHSMKGTGAATAAAVRRSSVNEQQLRQAEGSDPYVYEDLGEDPLDNEPGNEAAYGTRPPRRRHHSAMAGNYPLPPRPAGVSDAHYAQMIRQQRKWLNAPAQPPRPVSAAPFPAPISHQYVRPRSSRPWPDGTAAPIPSRVAAAAQAAAVDATDRPVSAHTTVIYPRGKQMPGGRGRNAWRTLSATVSSRSGGGLVSADAFINAVSAAFSTAAKPTGQREKSARQNLAVSGDGAGGGGNAAAADAAPQLSVRPDSTAVAAAAAAVSESLVGAGPSSSIQLTYTAPHEGKRLPWEAREHVAAAAAVGSIPPQMLSDLEALSPHAASSASHRRSSTGMSLTSLGGRKGTATGGGGGGGGTASRRQSQQQQQQGRRSSVFGETLPPDGVGREGDEHFAPRSFELHDGGIVLDGYMGHL